MSYTRCRFDSQPGGCTNKRCTFSHDHSDEHLRTLYCGGVSEKVDEEILYELFLNAGPLEKVVIPRDKETNQQKTFAFVVFQHQESTEFACNLLNGTELFGQPIRLQNRATGRGIGQHIASGYGRVGSRHLRSYTEPANIRHDVLKQGMGTGGFSVPGSPSNPWYTTSISYMSRRPTSRGVMLGGDLERRMKDDRDVNMNRMENHKTEEARERNTSRYFDEEKAEAVEEYGKRHNKTFDDDLKRVKEFIESKRKRVDERKVSDTGIRYEKDRGKDSEREARDAVGSIRRSKRWRDWDKPSESCKRTRENDNLVQEENRIKKLRSNDYDRSFSEGSRQRGRPGERF